MLLLEQVLGERIEHLVLPSFNGHVRGFTLLGGECLGTTCRRFGCLL